MRHEIVLAVADKWIPLSKGSQPDEALYEGLPPWIAVSVYGWTQKTLNELGWTHSGEDAEQVLTEAFDREMRLAQPLSISRYSATTELQERGDDVLTLDYVDFLLARIGDSIPSRTLEAILEQGGSAWRVGSRNGFPGLERRVPIAVQEVAEAAMASAGDAGLLLNEAWVAVYGRNPDPEDAYEKAIKAVESSAVPKVTPDDRKATLGKVISVMRSQKDWALALTDSEGKYDYGVVTGMCAALWSGQPSRHGGNGYRKPTVEEAEIAVQLAVALVQWFSVDAVRCRPRPRS